MKNKIDSLNSLKVPIIVFDKELEKLQGIVFFPEKIEKANEILAKVGLPKRELAMTMAKKSWSPFGTVKLLAIC